MTLPDTHADADAEMSGDVPDDVLGTVVISIPPDAEYLRVARFAAADAATRVGLPLDAVDDVRLAVSELCALLIGSGTTIEVRFEARAGAVVIEGRGAPGPGIHGENGELARVLVEAVVDDLHFDELEGAATFRFSKRVDA